MVITLGLKSLENKKNQPHQKSTGTRNHSSPGYQVFLQEEKLGPKFFHVSFFLQQCLANIINPFVAKVPILYPLKIPKNLQFSGVFKGYKMGRKTTYVLKPQRDLHNIFKVLQSNMNKFWIYYSLVIWGALDETVNSNYTDMSSTTRQAHISSKM